MEDIISSINVPTSIKDNLTTIVNAVKEENGVQSIILFGSYAYGVPNTDSDLDIAVVVNHPFEELSQFYRSIQKKLRRKLGIPLDLLIFNAERFQNRIEEGFGFEEEIAKRGIKLYG